MSVFMSIGWLEKKNPSQQSICDYNQLYSILFGEINSIMIRLNPMKQILLEYCFSCNTDSIFDA